MAFSTTHTRDTANPQSYWHHWYFAMRESFRIIGYGLGGIVHAFLPEIKVLQFWTSSGIIKTYRRLEQINRHDSEIAAIFGQERAEYVKQHRGG